jgi:hypothetical protein
MAAPNIRNIGSITPKTLGVALTTSYADILANSAASGKSLRVTSILVANVDGANSASVDMRRYDADAGGGTAFNRALGIVVPAGASVELMPAGKHLYLEEGDEIQARASASGDLVMDITYEELSE